MPGVAFATYAGGPGLTAEDALAAAALSNLGIRVSAAVWDDPSVDWHSHDLVIVRSTWDYHRKVERYRDWIRGFETSPGRLWNPHAVLLGNLDKRYLVDLARRGYGVVPTRFVDAGAQASLAALIEQSGWDDVVLKPAISGGADGAWRTGRTAAAADEERFREASGGQALLMQPLMPEVAAEGEWSLVFFHREYSHAALKRPAAGEFRVQERHGGSHRAAEPSPGLVAQARAFLDAIDGPLLYARVDGVVREGRFLLMELEVTEPALYLGCHPDAPARFARAILSHA